MSPDDFVVAYQTLAVRPDPGVGFVHDPDWDVNCAVDLAVRPALQCGAVRLWLHQLEVGSTEPEALPLIEFVFVVDAVLRPVFLQLEPEQDLLRSAVAILILRSYMFFLSV